ncbi:MAG: type I 3-dehydroquinate dehydratase [Holophaga sp.]|nr:type I 3-dehydroquinate dehydratase [Holophaga sp.]
MSPLPFYFVTLTHPTWEAAVACVRRLPAEALPELRLDLFPEYDPAELVDALARRCLVTCRRKTEGGCWEGTEAERLDHLLVALQARPAWIDLEWELDLTPEIIAHRSHTRLLRSVHVPKGVFDLETRLENLPKGDAYKWVGHAEHLSDNAQLKPLLARCHDLGIPLSAFLMGPKGLPSRCLQGAWGGAFTYAAPDDGPAAAPGQLPLSVMHGWRLHRLNPAFALCGVIGNPVLHSRGPAFHNARFQRNFKDLLYLPLECATAEEANQAMASLGILGLSITAPLKETLPVLLGLQGPLNTLWRRAPQEPWQGANTDAEALAKALAALAKGPVLLLGDGGVAATSRAVLEAHGFPCCQLSRRSADQDLANYRPIGVIQATRLGMDDGDPLPFPDQLHAALPSLRWAVEWVYKTDTAFAAWAREHNLQLIEGNTLFETQAEGQSSRFVQGCG